MNVFELLQQRGFVKQTSNEDGVRTLLAQPGATIYQGFDPSADSFTLGQLVPLMALHHLQKAGHRVIFILGGATGKIGDPTDKTKSRKLLDPETVAANGEKIKTQVEKIGLIRFTGENAALMLNNDEWLSRFSFLDDFLLQVARSFSVNEMVKMDTFAHRLKSEQHLSLLEFCYPVLQAWDFLHLFEEYNCRIQFGGQDQWANILAGAELIRRKHGEEAFAFTHPLVTTPSGEKMGKSVAGAVWLDAKKTNPFDFYQYLQGVPDEMVPGLLKMITTLPLDEIDVILQNHRKAQKRLAFEVTKLVHGEKVAQECSEDSEKLFNDNEGATPSPSPSLPLLLIPKGGLSLEKILTQEGTLPSISEVKRRVSQGAIRVDEETITDPKTVISKSCTIRYGKSSFLRVVVRK